MTNIYVEVRPQEAAGNLAPRLLSPELFEKRVKELGDSLVGIAQSLRTQLDRAITPSPDGGMGLNEVKMTFSLDLQGEAGVIISRVSASAGFEVSLTWKLSSYSCDAALRSSAR